MVLSFSVALCLSPIRKSQDTRVETRHEAHLTRGQLFNNETADERENSNGGKT